MAVHCEATLPDHDCILLKGMTGIDATWQSHLLLTLSYTSFEHTFAWLQMTTRQHPRIRECPQGG